MDAYEVEYRFSAKRFALLVILIALSSAVSLLLLSALIGGTPTDAPCIRPTKLIRQP